MKTKLLRRIRSKFEVYQISPSNKYVLRYSLGFRSFFGYPVFFYLIESTNSFSTLKEVMDFRRGRILYTAREAFLGSTLNKIRGIVRTRKTYIKIL